MTIPPRGQTGQNTYFISTQASERKNILQSDRMAGLLVDVLYSYRAQKKYLLHEFVVMPNHLHLLIRPLPDTTLEKAMQFIKGSFSFRAKKELNFKSDIWQPSFHDRRVRDWQEYEGRKKYIHQNPVVAGLVSSPELWPWSSANGKYEIDPYPGG
jgi:REP-associated tyrosine transposase